MSVYSGSRVRRGLWHFLLGKGVSSLAGLAAMLLVVRELAVAEFAAYSVLVALVEIVTALTGLGLSHVVLRYVPELFAAAEVRALRGLVLRAFGLRLLLLLAAVAVVLLDVPGFAALAGVGGWPDAFGLFLVLLVLRISAHFISQVLESTLHQAVAQLAFSLGALVRLVALLALLAGGQLDLQAVIYAEIIADGVSLAVLLGGTWRVLQAPTGALSGRWALDHWRRLARFAMAGYFQHLAILPYGGHTNRIVGGHLLATGAMAAYGFAQSLYEYAKRYLPAQLLVGLVRPVVIARYSESKDFSQAARLCQQVLQLNILLICALLVPLLIAGAPLLLALSAGKYGSEANWVLLALALVLLLETQRQQLELLAQTLERYELLLPTNVLLASSVLIALLLVGELGAVAFPLANALGLAVANSRVRLGLRRINAEFRHDWLGSLATLGLLALAVAVGRLLIWLGVDWWLGSSAGLLVYCGIAWCWRRSELLHFYRALVRGQSAGLPPLPAAAADATPRIAFGLLSYRPEAQATVAEIARLVHPHPLFVHHDFSKGHAFSCSVPNVRVLPSPVETAWGNWSLVAASFALMEAALADEGVTHFQLLSEACLPIRPITELVQHLQTTRPAAMVDCLRVSDARTFVSHGWRYVPGGLWGRRVSRRLSVWAWGRDPGHEQIAGVNLIVSGPSDQGWRKVRQGLSLWLLGVLHWWTGERLRRLGLNHLAIGGQWLGMERRMAVWLLQVRQSCPDLVAHFQQSHIPDEAFFQTLISHAAEQGRPQVVMQPGSHAMSWAGNGTGPDVIGTANLAAVLASERFFARKFAMNLDDMARCHVVATHLGSR
ncbi:beta-1,6-N-acetylglucosaminyltransferase [Roseateles sp.]|jgi:O-antigen/teichoic acid export membrane protein|uniref:beta-1,6-N-acetylglucosaminyltransferase n=1 Tax=Roseateles sp. TaxID=1971397 RepID=UPI00391A8C82